MSDNCSTGIFFKPNAPTYGFCRRESPLAKVGFPIVPSDESGVVNTNPGAKHDC